MNFFGWITETKTFKKLDESFSNQVSNINPDILLIVLNVILYTILFYFIISLSIRLIKQAKRPAKDLVKQYKDNLKSTSEDSQQKSTILTLIDQVNDEIKDSIEHHINGDEDSLRTHGLKIMEFISSQLPLSLKSTKSINHRCAVFVPDPEKPSKLKVLEGCGYSIKGKQNLRLDKVNSIAGKAYTNGEYQYIKDVTKSKDFVKNPKQTKPYYSLLCYPVKIGDDVVAVLSVDGSEKDCFTKDDISYIKMFSNQIGIIFSLNNYNVEKERNGRVSDGEVQKIGWC